MKQLLHLAVNGKDIYCLGDLVDEIDHWIYVKDVKDVIWDLTTAGKISSLRDTIYPGQEAIRFNKSFIVSIYDVEEY